MSNLPLVENCEYVLTQNICNEIGLVKNTRIKLLKICVNEIPEINNNRCQLIKMPPYILTQLVSNKPNTKASIFNISNTIPIFPYKVFE